jgi:hypothetical protein
MTRSRHRRSSCFALRDFLFDHLVGAHQQPGRKFDPERLRRFEVEGQLDSCSLLDRQIGWFLAFEDAPGITGVRLICE